MNAKTFALTAALLALLQAGCAEDRATLEIQAVCYPSDDCTFGDECDAQLMGSFTHFVGSGNFLWVPLQVANQLPNNGDLETGRVNTNDAHVTGVEVDFSGVVTGTAVLDWGNQFVPANGTSVISVYLPTPAPPAGGGNVYADFRLVGYYDNDREFVTPDFHLGYWADDGAAAPTCADPAEFETCPGTGSQTPLVCGT